jgi:hypothetical protein
MKTMPKIVGTERMNFNEGTMEETLQEVLKFIESEKVIPENLVLHPYEEMGRFKDECFWLATLYFFRAGGDNVT